MQSLKFHQRFLYRFRIIIKIIYIIFTIIIIFYILTVWEEIGFFGWIFSVFFAGALFFFMFFYNVYLYDLRMTILEYKIKEAEYSSIYDLMEYKKELT